MDHQGTKILSIAFRLEYFATSLRLSIKSLMIDIKCVAMEEKRSECRDGPLYRQLLSDHLDYMGFNARNKNDKPTTEMITTKGRFKIGVLMDEMNFLYVEL